MSVPAIAILFASQTGTVEHFASRLQQQLEKLYGANLLVKLACVEEIWPISTLSELADLILFITSTAGDGQPPDNLLKFWKCIMHKGLPPEETFPKLKFCLAAFGDSSYANYNSVGKKLFRRLVQLGAKPAKLVGYEDEACLMDDNAPGGVMEGIAKFTEAFIPYLEHAFNLPNNFQSWKMLESPSFVYSIHSTQHIEISTLDSTWVSVEEPTEEFLNLPKATDMQCLSNSRVTAEDHFQDTRLLSFKVDAPGDYVPGDVVLLQPKNAEEDIEQFCRLVGVSPEEQVLVKGCDFIPLRPLPINSIVRNYIDLNRVPNQFFFIDLASCHISVDRQHYEDDLERLDMESERLLELGHAMTDEDVDDLYDYVTRMKRTVLETLSDFPLTARLLKVSMWLRVFTRPVKARPYSICSAPHEPLRVLVAVVQYKTKMKKERVGLCSTFLARMKPGDRVKGRIISNTNYLRFDRHLISGHPVPPCIMVGPGTCVSPFRSFVLHQRQLGCRLSAPNLLIFGCRSSTADNYFLDEWHDLEADGRVRVLRALSREPNQPKTYVQHVIEREAELISKYLTQFQASVMIVANNSNMLKDTRLAFESLLTLASDKSLNGKNVLKTLESQRRFQVEAWG